MPSFASVKIGNGDNPAELLNEHRSPFYERWTLSKDF